MPRLEKWVGESAGLFTFTTIDWQIKRSPVCLIAYHKITPLLTPLPHGRGMMLNVAISMLFLSKKQPPPKNRRRCAIANQSMIPVSFVLSLYC
ncbi:hypothetical protein [Nostoc sp. LPT]|uniref:hypothetical protein n=1 Tax=Nostoc sp. LPT TaxID=2815387 RepID=UPI001D449842|nr:hypothetical protein [Nostoc sp. LPT]MBN4006085.1 hypothetical protein [Nostoc sp. LPT]